MIILNEKELEILRKEANSKEDFQRILDENGLHYTKESLEECYNTVKKGGDLTLDDLDNVYGGYVPTGKATHAVAKCYNCNKRIKVPLDPKRRVKCSNCLTWNNINTCRMGC